MKNLTKGFLFIAFAMFSIQSFAQTFGIQAGLNMGSLKIKNEGQDVTDGKKMLLGFNVGATAEFDFSEALAFQTGLILNQKGVKLESSYDEMGITVNAKDKLSILFLDIPLNVKYKLDLGGNKLYLAAGPYLGIALSGKDKYEVSAVGVSEKTEDNLKFGNSEDDDFKSLDFGVNVGAGLEFGAFGVGVQYGLGIANLTPKGDSDNLSKSRLLSISVAYKFGK